MTLWYVRSVLVASAVIMTSSQPTQTRNTRDTEQLLHETLSQVEYLGQELVNAGVIHNAQCEKIEQLEKTLGQYTSSSPGTQAGAAETQSTQGESVEHTDRLHFYAIANSALQAQLDTAIAQCYMYKHGIDNLQRQVSMTTVRLQQEQFAHAESARRHEQLQHTHAAEAQRFQQGHAETEARHASLLQTKDADIDRLRVKVYQKMPAELRVHKMEAQRCQQQLAESDARYASMVQAKDARITGLTRRANDKIKSLRKTLRQDTQSLGSGVENVQALLLDVDTAAGVLLDENSDTQNQLLMLHHDLDAAKYEAQSARNDFSDFDPSRALSPFQANLQRIRLERCMSDFIRHKTSPGMVPSTHPPAVMDDHSANTHSSPA